MRDLVRCVSASVFVCLVGASCGPADDSEQDTSNSPAGRKPPAATAGTPIVIRNGIDFFNGLKLTNGTTLENGLRLTNGFDLSDGVENLNGVNLKNYTIAPPEGSDLDKWLDADIENNLRILNYLIECALPGTITITVIHNEITHPFKGVANLGPTWISKGQMSVGDQEKVSACMISRVNARGAVVDINIMGPFDGWTTRSDLELSSYPTGEAAFFGNLFLSPPQAYMCSYYNALGGDVCETRACNAETGCDCGIVQVSETLDGTTRSSCRRHCAFLGDAGQTYFLNCNLGTRTWAHVVTSYIK